MRCRGSSWQRLKHNEGGAEDGRDTRTCGGVAVGLGYAHCAAAHILGPQSLSVRSVFRH